jgi:amino acid adenylation domain-containing protein/thioester reductase-like protein
LGGHSLLATQVISKIRSQMNLELPLKAIFERSRIAQLAELIATTEKSDIPPIRPVDRSAFERLPLSFVQERLWFLNQMDLGSVVYNIPIAFVLRGELNVNQLEQAFNMIIARHENLRTVFPSHEGQAQQVILDKCDFKLECIDLSHYKSEEECERKAREICQTDAATPFDLNEGPLFRGMVIKVAEQKHVLMLNMHHIISDGWSISILMRELGLIMESFRHGQVPELEPIPIQYVDYSVWQRSWMEESGVLKQQLGYWQTKLAGRTESLDLATDYPRPSVQSFPGATQRFAVPAQLTEQLKNLAEQQSCTLYMVLLAAFNVLLNRYSTQSDICVGSPIANRQYGETENLIGMFVNTLVLRSQVEPEETFCKFLSQVKTTCLEAYEHQDAPFEKLVDMLRPERNLAISPLFQVMVILQNVDMGTMDERFPRFPLESGVSKVDLTAEFTETAQGLAGSIEYSTALFKPQSIARMAEHFNTLCRAITATPAAKIRELNCIPETEKRQLLVEFNDTRADYAKDKCLHELFVEQAAKQGEKTAVVCGEERVSYEQLYERSRDLALYLQSQGVKPESLVGVCMERSVEMLVGMLGILQAGGAYVPLDPEHPEERLAYMVRDSRAGMVLTQEKLEERLKGWTPTSTQIIAVDRQWSEIGESVAEPKGKKVELKHEVRPQHLAYVIYTSGSTGQPKGVAIEHHSPVTLVNWASEVYSREELAGVLAATSICFDLSVYEIFVTLAHGGTIILVSDALCLMNLSEEEKESITLINTVPSAMEELVRLGAIPGSVRTINLAGEPLTSVLVDKIYDNSSAGKVYDLYGPSEDTTYSTYMLRKKNGVQSIGRPIANTQVYILDQYKQPQPIGVPGELYIAGDGLARGYLNRAEMTEERFVANPFEGGRRMYKTGDLARWLEDGNLQYLGRIDTQVKIRGFRIELGEIEARLNEHVGVQESVVVVQGQEGNKQLIAFYRAEETQGEEVVELEYEELREHLLKCLPEYMIPAAFVSLAAIPLNPNGKVDRRALAQMDVAIESAQEYAAPRNEQERQLVEIWSQVLNLAPEKIGFNDNFFQLGGHSLLAAQLIAKIRSQMDIDLPLKAIFERNSVAQLAELIATADKSEIPPIRPVDRSAFERLPLSFAQERLWFIHQLNPESAGYNVPVAITINGELDINQLEQAFNVIISRHENLRTVFPSYEGQAQQVILDKFDFKLERIDLDHYLSQEERDNKAKEICEADVAAPFDLARGPLFRGKVIKVSEQKHILILNMHHIVSDGWSIGVLTKELGVIMEAFRQGRQPMLASLPIQYVDYSVWQRKWLEEGGVLKQQLAYWQKKLAGVAESLDLATDYPRPSVQTFAGANQQFVFDRQLADKLKGLAEHKGGTLFMILLTAFKVLLYRYSGQNDICIGSPMSNRQYAEAENLIGMFVDTLALRSRIEGDDTFSALLSQVKTTCLEAYEHQDAPFEKVVDMVRPQRNLAITPIFQVMVVLQNADMGTLDERFPIYALDNGISKFDLTVAFAETPDGMEGVIEYNTALYKPQTIARMTEHFVALCRAIATTPTAKIRDLDYLGQAEKQQLLTGYNDTRANYPKDKCIHDLFVEQVAGNPEKSAVVFGDQELSYLELHSKTTDLSMYLQSQGVKPESVVGLCLERSPEMMIGIMGTVQAGGAYLPLDPVYPDDRLAYMLEDSQAEIVLTQERFKSKIRSLVPDVKLIILDKQWPEISKNAAALRAKNVELQHDVKPNHACYVIYTSGSTGKPKGVLVEHRALVNRINWMQKCYRLDERDVVVQKTPYSFDVSVWEFFWPMMAGAAVVFAAPGGHKDVDYLENLINKVKVTTLHFVPSMLRTFLENAAVGCGGVRQIFCSGEALDKKCVDDYKTKFPNAVLHNLYGPTEAAIDVTAYDCSRLSYPFVPIGAPIDNIQIHILDQHNRLQPIGMPGELHIAGDGLARGYLNRAKLTQEKFVANPFQPGTRMYKTGDLARWLDDGNIQYLGRIDTQVKIRGFRIETGEIEAQLNQHLEIQDSAVVTQGQGADIQLIAFYCAKGTEGDRLVQLSHEELRGHMLQALPEYMMPAAFVSLAAIPLNPNGKVDRKALSRMQVKIASAQEYVAPRNDTEKQLAKIWAQVLNLAPEKIGANDNFFELGGHSLLAVRLIERMRQQGLHAKLQTLFTASTLAKLAAVVESGETSDIGADQAAPDLDHEAILDPTIVLRTNGKPGEMKNAFLTGATGFLGAFLLSDLLVETHANIHCLVRAASAGAGYKKIEERMKSLGLWNASFRERIVPVLGDLTSPLIGLTQSKFEELANSIDVIYHIGAAINFYYPYSWHKAANVASTETLLRMASFGRSKSFHYVSTLSVVLAQEPEEWRPVITDNDPLPSAPNLSDGYVQSKWVAEKLVASAGSRGIPVVTYRPGTIMGDSSTGLTNLEDFVPSFIRGCIQSECVPDGEVHDELHVIPVDYVSGAIVAISKRHEFFGRVFNLTTPHGTTGREMLDYLQMFDPSVQRVSYEEWRAQVSSDPGNALSRHIGSFPDQLPENRVVWPQFDSEETMRIVEAAGIERPQISQKLLESYFAYIAEHTPSRAVVGAD